MRRISLLVLAAIAAASSPVRSDAGLIIDLNFINSGTAPTTFGSGTLDSVIRAAADVWELAFNSSDFNHQLYLEYGWYNGLDSTTLAVHNLTMEGGIPNRETEGFILFNNEDFSFFMDGSINPGSLSQLIASSTEFSGYTESTGNYFGNMINNGRRFTSASGAAADRYDAFTVALHEIGHALGMSSGNTSYQAESWPDNDIDITGSMPFAGSALPTTNLANPVVNPLDSNAHLNISSSLLFPSISAGIRRLPSAVDILANAQLSQFTNPNLDLHQAPEPSGLLLAGIVGSMGLVVSVRRRRSSRSDRDTTTSA